MKIPLNFTRTLREILWNFIKVLIERQSGDFEIGEKFCWVKLCCVHCNLASVFPPCDWHLSQ